MVTSGGKKEKVTVTAQFEAAGQFLLSVNIVEIQKIQVVRWWVTRKARYVQNRKTSYAYLKGFIYKIGEKLFF